MNHTIKYIVNPEKTGEKNGKPYKGVVVCVIDGTKDEVREKIMGFMNKCRAFPHQISTFYAVADNYAIQEKYVGVAYCSEGDEYNEEIGKEIARTRALVKLRADLFRKLNEYMGDMDDFYVDIDSELTKLYQLNQKPHDFTTPVSEGY